MGKRYDEITPARLDNTAGRNIFYPVLEMKPYPDSNPNALIQKGVYFLSADKWLEGSEGKVCYIDRLSGDTVYLNRLDTMYSHDRYIMTELVGIISEDVGHNMPGIDSTTFKTWGISSVADTAIAAQANYNDRGIYLNTNRGQKGINSKIYELRSTFRHELIHLRDWDKEVQRKNAGHPYTFRDHANVYLEQMTYPEFSNTSGDYQRYIVVGYAQRLFSQLLTEPNSDSFNKALEDFNQTIGKQIEAKLTPMPGGVPELKNVSEIKLVFKGKLYTIPYNPLEKAYD